MPITLALGGGGARGVAHLGIIEGLLEAGFTIERIVGVSSGSLAGGMYAFDPDIKRAQDKALTYLLSDSFQEHQQTLFGASPSADESTTGGLFTWYERVISYLRMNRYFYRVARKPSLLPGVILTDVVEHLFDDVDLAEAKIPFSVVTVDLRTGHNVVLERGSLRDAVRASSSLPGIFPPVEVDGMLLCDIGVFYSLPTLIARSYGPTCLVAVDVGSDLQPLNRCETAMDVLMRMDEIGEALFRKHVRDAADFVITPKVFGVEWFDFSRSREVISAGLEAARGSAGAIKAFYSATSARPEHASSNR